MRRRLSQKGQNTQQDYNREAEKFMRWCQGEAAGAPPSKALYRRYFLEHEQDTRFQNSGVQMNCVCCFVIGLPAGWTISSHIRWYLLQEHDIYVSSDSAKTGCMFLLCLCA